MAARRCTKLQCQSVSTKFPLSQRRRTLLNTRLPLNVSNSVNIWAERARVLSASPSAPKEQSERRATSKSSETQHQRMQIRSDGALWIFHPKKPSSAVCEARFAKASLCFRWIKEEVSAGSTVTQFGPRLLKYSLLSLWQRQRLGQFEQQCRCTSPRLFPRRMLYTVRVFATRPMRHTSSSLDRAKCSPECNLLTSGPCAVFLWCGAVQFGRDVHSSNSLALCSCAVLGERPGWFFSNWAGADGWFMTPRTKPSPGSCSQSFDLYSIHTTLSDFI